jgi:hypothetical protein
LRRPIAGGGVSVNPNRSINALAIAADVKASRGLDSTAGSRTDKISVKRSAQLGTSGDNRIVKIDFEFECARDGGAALTQAQRTEFEGDVCREIIRLQEWAADLDWIELPLSELKIIVSDRYGISKSLVPAWSGLAGYMEFPTRRVAARKAAIMHELAHVFFPNGNRFLAEGLAVHLQDSIGGNPAFPNFGKPLHRNVCERLLEMTPHNSTADPLGLGQIHVAELDLIPTPNPLTLRVGAELYGEDRRGQAFLYPLAGSFVRFLLETRGVERFRSLYTQTQLLPLALNAGSPDRWSDVYRITLADFEGEWKSMIVSEFSVANCETFEVTKIAADQPKQERRHA